jgi:hypothetical protein
LFTAGEVDRTIQPPVPLEDIVRTFSVRDEEVMFVVVPLMRNRTETVVPTTVLCFA